MLSTVRIDYQSGPKLRFGCMTVGLSINCCSNAHKNRILRSHTGNVRDAYSCVLRISTQRVYLKLKSYPPANAGRAMRFNYLTGQLPACPAHFMLAVRSAIVPVAVVAALIFLTGGAAAQAPTGGGGGAGSTAGWETILDNLYNVLYITLQYVGLTVLVLGFIVWLTARNNSQRSETGMKLTMGGGAMVVAYFGLGALVSLLEFIAG